MMNTTALLATGDSLRGKASCCPALPMFIFRSIRLQHTVVQDCSSCPSHGATCLLSCHEELAITAL